jgi:hypothetical protein
MGDLQMTPPEPRMGSFAKIALAAIICLCAAACGANPIIARDPIPPPDPAYAAICHSSPSILNSYVTTCLPAAKAPLETVVVSAKN